jgi:hypothetical protein
MGRIDRADVDDEVGLRQHQRILHSDANSRNSSVSLTGARVDAALGAAENAARPLSLRAYSSITFENNTQRCPSKRASRICFIGL